MASLPEIDVFRAMILGLVNVIVAGPPQSNVTAPPPAKAVVKAASVQLPGVPVPTTPLLGALTCGATRVGPEAAPGTLLGVDIGAVGSTATLGAACTDATAAQMQIVNAKISSKRGTPRDRNAISNLLRSKGMFGFACERKKGRPGESACPARW